MSGTTDALRVEGLSVTFPRGQEVLHDIGLRVSPGECLGIVGSSGAGKSVLARALLGLADEHAPGTRVAASRFEIAGEDVRDLGRRGWRRLRGGAVSLVLQDALQSLDPLRRVGDEVAEALALRGVGRRERRRRALTAMHEAGLQDAEQRFALRSEELSGGMRQRALIASAIVSESPVLIADEPTTALDATTAVRVLDVLSRLREGGTAVVLISHDLDAVARVADRVMVLDAGRVVEEGPVAAVLSSPSHAATRALVLPVAPPAPPGPGEEGAVLLRAQGLVRDHRRPGTTRPPALGGVDLEVRAGEALGVVGESGSGKTTLARLLVGAERPDAGTVGGPEGTSARVALVPQDPLGSFDPRLTVGTILRQALDGGEGDPEGLLARVGLDAGLLRRRPRTLSGGQRQRVAIARALARGPRLLVCDEPVSALDRATQAGILSLLGDLRDEGIGVLMISHDLGVVRALCERVLVLKDGRVVESGPTQEVFSSPRDPFTRELVDAASFRL